MGQKQLRSGEANSAPARPARGFGVREPRRCLDLLLRLGDSVAPTRGRHTRGHNTRTVPFSPSDAREGV